MKLSKKQKEVLIKMEAGKWFSPYDLKVSRATLNALLDRGLVEHRAELGHLFSPTTANKYRKISQIICLGRTDDDNPLCFCPDCGHESQLMNDFSYLKAGFNGIKEGDPDDLDMQECGNCKSKLQWNWD